MYRYRWTLLMTSWWRHHRLNGSLITDENGTFCTITRPFVIRSSPNLIWMIVWGQWRIMSNDVMMTSSMTSRFIDYGRKFSMFAFKGVFDPFRVEIGQIWPRTPWKRIISAFRRAWPHVKIPTRTKVTAKNVTPFYLFQAQFWLLSMITSSFYIRSSPNLVGWLMYE